MRQQAKPDTVSTNVGLRFASSAKARRDNDATTRCNDFKHEATHDDSTQSSSSMQRLQASLALNQNLHYPKPEESTKTPQGVPLAPGVHETAGKAPRMSGDR
jgi:hypothetical protein